jgi:hypothetical protein
LNDEASAESEQVPDSNSGYLSPDYITTRASAMMMADELILIDQLNEEEDRGKPKDSTKMYLVTIPTTTLACVPLRLVSSHTPPKR